jgi:hypothetical protein
MDSITQSIILWGAVAGALTGIITLIVKAIRAAKKASAYFTDLKTNVDTLVKHDQAQYKAILRLTVMSDNIPLSERIIAGKEYIDLDGNGDVKAFYEQHLKPYDKIPKGA